jgi:RimJ/RimL family protein N-acetyltransferase
MRLVFGQDARIGAFVASLVPHMDAPRDFQAIGVADADGTLLAGCIYHNYIPRYAGLEISFAATSPRWATRGVCRALLHYPIVQLGCRRVTTVIPHDNQRAIKFNLGIGFAREGTLRHFYAPKRHAVVCGFLASDYERLFAAKESVS